MKTSVKKSTKTAPKKKTATAAKPVAKKKAAPKKKMAVKKAAPAKKATPMKKATFMKKAAPVPKAAAKRPTSPIAVPLKKSAARKSNVIAARRALAAERKEQPQQPMAKEAGTAAELNAAQEDKQDQHQPMAERPAPTYDPTPDTNVPLRGQTAVRGAQTARVAANKTNRARIGNHRKH